MCVSLCDSQSSVRKAISERRPNFAPPLPGSIHPLSSFSLPSTPSICFLHSAEEEEEEEEVKICWCVEGAWMKTTSNISGAAQGTSRHINVQMSRLINLHILCSICILIKPVVKKMTTSAVVFDTQAHSLTLLLLGALHIFAKPLCSVGNLNQPIAFCSATIVTATDAGYVIGSHWAKLHRRSAAWESHHSGKWSCVSHAIYSYKATFHFFFSSPLTEMYSGSIFLWVDP